MKIIKNSAYLLVILIGVIPLFDLLHSGLPLTHDGQDHVARIANFYQNLAEGVIVPRWAPFLNWGFGHPILMFLYPLPSYVASLFHFLGFSLIDSIKIVFGVGFIASGLAMYLWIQNFLGKNAGIVAATLYMFAPYRFIDLYVRGAIGEHVAFIFMPLIFYNMYLLSKKISKWYLLGGSLSLAGLLLSHNAISLMFFPLIFLYAAYLSMKIKNKTLYILHNTYYIILGMGLAAFFWVPAFFEGKYTLRDIVTAGEYANRFTDFTQFIYSPWSFGGSGAFSLQVGIVHWVVLLLSIPITYLLYKKENRLWILSLSTIILFVLSIFIMTPLSKFIWESVTILQKFQFPWRFMSIAVFLVGLLGGLGMYVVPNKLKRLVVFCVIVLVLFFNKDFWSANGYLEKPESFYTGIYHGTTDTGESAPIWSVRFMLEEPSAFMETIDGDAEIKQVSRNSTNHVYKIDAQSRTRFRENTLYFPGWEVYVDGVRVEDVEFQDPANRGLITFYVEQGKHDVEVKFEDTKLRMFANAVSAASLVMIGYVILTRHRKKTTSVEI